MSETLAVNLPENDVNAPHNEYQVGQHGPSGDLRQNTQIDKRRSTRLDPIGACRSVTHDIESQLAARGLGPDIDFTVIRPDALGDRRLHISRRNGFEGLLNDANALLHFAHSDNMPVPAITDRADLSFSHHDVPMKFVVHRVRIIAPPVPVDARASQHRSTAGIIDCDIARKDTHLRGSLYKDLVVGKKVVEIHKPRFEILAEFLRLLDKRQRQVVGNSSHPNIIVEETGAACHLKQVEDKFTVAEGIEKGRKRAGIDAERADGNEMAGDSLKLGHDHPDVLNTLRNFNFKKPFDGQGICQVVVHRGHIVHAIHIGNNLLVVRHVLGVLFKAPVEISYVRNGVDDDLTVDNDLKAKHTVGRGVLRPHVDDHLIGTKRSAAGGLQILSLGNIIGVYYSTFSHQD